MSINIDQIFPVNSTVVGLSSTDASLAGNFLTRNSLVPNDPVNRVLTFYDAKTVGQWFGTNSDEYSAATVYFKRFTNATKSPKFLLFSRFIDTDISPYATGGVVTASLADFKAITAGTLTYNIDGVASPVTGINLSTATSLSDVASKIQVALRAGITGLTSANFTYNGEAKKFNFDTMQTGPTHYISLANSSPLALLLKMTATDGGFVSQGATGQSTVDNLTAITDINRDFCTLSRIFTTDGDTSYTIDLAISSWINGQNDSYKYVPWLTETNLTVQGNTNNFASVLANYAYDNILPVYNTLQLAAFVTSFAASTDYRAANGTISYAFRAQAGLLPTVTTDAIAIALLSKGVSFYGDYKSTATDYRFFQDGTITGKFGFGENFDNNYWLKDQLQNTYATLFGGINKISDSPEGYIQVQTAVKNMMQKALTNGVSKTNVSIDDDTALILQNQAGFNVAPLITQSGFYYQIIPNSSSDRASHQPVKSHLWYINGGNILSIQTTLTLVK